MSNKQLTSREAAAEILWDILSSLDGEVIDGLGPIDGHVIGIEGELSDGQQFTATLKLDDLELQ